MIHLLRGAGLVLGFFVLLATALRSWDFASEVHRVLHAWHAARVGHHRAPAHRVGSMRNWDTRARQL